MILKKTIYNDDKNYAPREGEQIFGPNENRSTAESPIVQAQMAREDATEASKRASEAVKTAGEAAEIANAVSQKVWSDDSGLHISDGNQDAAATRNTIWNSLGMLFRKGLNPILGILTGNNPRVVVYDGNGSDPQNEVASFGSTAVVGQALNGKTRTVTAPDGVDLLRRENGSDVTLAHFGYDYGTPEQPGQPQVENPYYTFGYRLPNYDVGNWSVAEGYRTVASGFASHAEGHYTVASGLGSHAEGSQTVASHNYSHAEGYLTVASGPSSHAEGGHTVASDYAHAEGWRTIAHDNCHVEGQYNIEDANSKYAHIIGNGTSEGARSNALTVDWDGTIRTDKNSMKTLWSGSWFMDASHTATLSEKVSEQLTGIVLVWSYYTGGAAQDYGWHTTFIPKAMVQLHNGVGWDIELRRTKNATFGTKYVYVNDDRIVGHADNVATGTANNVPYQNNKWVLRYVFGC